MKRTFFLLLLAILPICMMGSNTFKIKEANICYDETESKQVKRAIADLQADIKLVTGTSPAISGKGRIVVGTYGKSKTIKKLIKQGIVKEADLKGRWESYVLTMTDEKEPRLVIAGSDTRGTIYGIYELSERIGVSPWNWWADVPAKKNPDVSIEIRND